jgi:mRNA interferase RelE/StbE
VSYRIEVLPAAVKALRRVDGPNRKRIEGAILVLAQDPRPPASRKLRGRDGYRVRIGAYRILYDVHDDVLLLVIVTVGHRREVYER